MICIFPDEEVIGSASLQRCKECLPLSQFTNRGPTSVIVIVIIIVIFILILIFTYLSLATEVQLQIYEIAGGH